MDRALKRAGLRPDEVKIYWCELDKIKNWGGTTSKLRGVAKRIGDKKLIVAVRTPEHPDAPFDDVQTPYPLAWWKDAFNRYFNIDTRKTELLNAGTKWHGVFVLTRKED